MTPQGWKTYRDFVLKIEPDQAGKYRVEAQGPSGEGVATFSLPFDEKDLKIFLLEVAQTRRVDTRGAIPDPARPTVEFGKTLFNAVFKDSVRDTYLSARSEAEQKGYGLRLRLRLVETPELADLPWEYLYDGRDFLALSGNSPLVRYLDLPGSPRPFAVRLPLRVLVTVSSPLHFPALDVEKEKANIYGALKGMVDNHKVELVFTADATLKTLQRTLQKARSEGKPFHIWHFIGHGRFDQQSQAGQLALCNPEGQLSVVDGFQLGTLFNTYPEIRLVLLNACEGARSSREDPFAGVAASLVERGIPAVIGMQFAITDTAAITFSEEFYSALVNGLPVDAALTEARRAVFFMPNWIEWATPVLFMRSPDGMLFNIQVAPARKKAETAVTSAVADAPPPVLGDSDAAQAIEQAMPVIEKIEAQTIAAQNAGAASAAKKSPVRIYVIVLAALVLLAVQVYALPLINQNASPPQSTQTFFALGDATGTSRYLLGLPGATQTSLAALVSPGATLTPMTAPVSPVPGGNVLAPLLTLPGSDVIRSAAFSPDGTILAAGYEMGGVRLWQVSDGSLLGSFETGTAVGSLDFSPDGQTLATGLSNTTVKLWRVSDGERLATFEGLLGYVYSVAFSPDGQSLAAGSFDMGVIVWRVSDGSILHNLEGHTQHVYDLAYSPDSQTLASASTDHTVKLWRISDGELLLDLKWNGGFDSVAFSPDGQMVAGGGIVTKLWRASDGAPLHDLTGHTSTVQSMVFADGGLSLLTASNDIEVRRWLVQDWTRLYTIEENGEDVNFVTFSADGSMLAAVYRDGTVKLWQVP